jgi:hypothetical protein
MALDVTRVQTWAAGIEDVPGGVAGKLEALAEAGADLDFVIARRSPDKPATGVVFVAPIAQAQEGAAKEAGFDTSDSLHTLRVQGPDAPGLGARMTRAVADAGLNMRGLSAAAIKGQCVCYLAFDTDADAEKAAGIIRNL